MEVYKTMWPTQFSSHILKNFEKQWSQRLFKESYEFKVFGGTKLTVVFDREKLHEPAKGHLISKANFEVFI